ncbi:MAG: endolytic transglycosylase MltG [Pseudomonadota bacterium]
MKRFTFLATGLLFLIMVFLFIGFGIFYITPADKRGTSRAFLVKEGLSLKEVASELEERKVITSRTLFGLWAKIMGAGKRIKSGEYLLGPQMAPVRVLEILTRGAVITHLITIPEGFTREQIAELLESKNLLPKQAFLSDTSNSALLNQHGLTARTLEGYLYPDTYKFARGLLASTIIHAMVGRFWQMVGPLKKRAEEVGMAMEDVVILASIVEKETALPEERPMIASVFLNRLKRRMRLASDPTVIYGMENFNGNLTRKDLETPTPYNTYIIHGLPPGPIANPGLESIRAVLWPAMTDYLYFVSKNDGSHHFSRNLSEHNRAVRIYQKKRSSRRDKTS